MDRYSAVVLFGPGGVGKETVGSALAKRLTLFHHISSGDAVRDIFAEADKPDASEEVKKRSGILHSYVDNCRLIADDVVVPLFRDAVAMRIKRGAYNPKNNEVLLVDGMYRTKEQARMLEDFLDVREVHNMTNVPNFEILRRIEERRQNAIKTGKEPRTDDDPVKAPLRLAEFYSDTYPTLDCFLEKGIPIHCVDALPEAKKVEEALYQYSREKLVQYLPGSRARIL